MKDEYDKKKELQKMKINNLEKNNKNQIKYYENEINIYIK